MTDQNRRDLPRVIRLHHRPRSETGLLSWKGEILPFRRNRSSTELADEATFGRFRRTPTGRRSGKAASSSRDTPL